MGHTLLLVSSSSRQICRELKMNPSLCTAVVVICFFGAAISQETPKMWRPKFCKSLDCPPFATLNMMMGDELESRLYNASNWVGTAQEMDSWKINNWFFRMFFNPEMKMFQKLFDYIKENNVAMTAPVLTRYEDKGNGKTKVEMMFYLNATYARTAGKPADPEVWLWPVPEKTHMLVRSFPSLFFTWPNQWDNNLKKMRQSVAKANEQMPGQLKPVNPMVYYTVVYDEPWAMNRHNEIWMEDMKMQ